MRVALNRIALIVAALLTLYISGIVVRERYGLRVTVRNQGSGILRDVGLKVQERGGKYPLGDIRPGDQKRLFVQPVTESHIDVEFVGADNVVHSETIVGYAEAGYCGSVTVTMRTAARSEVNSRLDCWRSWLEFI